MTDDKPADGKPRLRPPAGFGDVTLQESGKTFTLIGTEAFRRSRKMPKDETGKL
jgi:hypothetical protein